MAAIRKIKSVRFAAAFVSIHETEGSVRAKGDKGRHPARRRARAWKLARQESFLTKLPISE
jgi:hypothetical protein